MLPGVLTYFQQESIDRLNLQSVCYMGKSPDGNCMFNGVSQGFSGMSAAAICLQPCNGEDRQAELRSMVVMHCSLMLQAVLQQDSQAILNNHAEFNVQQKRQPSVPIANLLASAVAKDKVWVGYACVKALAVALGKDVVLICKSALTLFTIRILSMAIDQINNNNNNLNAFQLMMS
ncbi:TPA: hypothetical protein ACH3X2_003131 [Trebouxia sp. C0005]